MVIHKTTQKTELFDGETGEAVYFRGSDVNRALQHLLEYGFGKPVTYTGTLPTNWQGGGLRDPQLQFFSKEQKREIVAKPLKRFLLEKGIMPNERHTGHIPLHFNNGELWTGRQ